MHIHDTAWMYCKIFMDYVTSLSRLKTRTVKSYNGDQRKSP